MGFRSASSQGSGLQTKDITPAGPAQCFAPERVELRGFWTRSAQLQPWSSLPGPDGQRLAAHASSGLNKGTESDGALVPTAQ
ncbi:hypothetical protein VTN77DRAFT_4034 [Rasamsonia byssochlamydoides]|uniref:uncharacterized protein n=1 Tax=Rasamsonia byssochlamydoides TaxID=89139 RepID=UPI0037441E3F